MDRTEVAKNKKNKKRREQLQHVLEMADENIRPFLERLVDDAIKWEQQLNECWEKLDKIEINAKTKNAYAFYSKLAKEAQQQYTNVAKVLISSVRKDLIQGDDDFEKFLEEMKNGQQD